MGWPRWHRNGVALASAWGSAVYNGAMERGARVRGRWAARLALVLTGVVMAAGCAPLAGSPQDAAPIPPSAPTAPPPVQPTVSESPTTPATAQLGALDEFEHLIFGTSPNSTTEEMRGQFARDTRLSEELIAACMAEQGFRYIPRQDEIVATVTENSTGLELGTREFAEQYGFGISADIVLASTTFGPAADNNPNTEFRNAMSAAERAAWDEALFGIPPDGSNVPIALGCAGQADQMLRQPKEFAALSNEISAFRQSLLAGFPPEIAALNSEWTRCMAGSGFAQLSTPEHLRQSLQQQWWELSVGWVFGEPDEFGNMVVTSMPNSPEPTAAQLVNFTNNEIALAVTDFDCREQISYDQRFWAIELELQQEFVDRNLVELELWVEHAERLRAGITE